MVATTDEKIGDMTELIQQLHSAAERQGVDVGSLFEQIVMTAYQDLLQPGDFAIDVGAHAGFHMFPMAEAVGARGKIYAYEPIPVLYESLQKQLKKRRLKQVKLFNLALGDVSGDTTFSYFEKQPAFSGLQQRPTPFEPTDGGLQEITVKCRRLDQSMPWFKKISFMKMDIEGGEYRALLGAERMLRKSRPIIILENGQGQSAQNYNYSADEFFGFFERHNMQLFLLTGQPYSRSDWHTCVNCWECVALPAEKVHLAENFPGYCRRVLGDSSAAA